MRLNIYYNLLMFIVVAFLCLYFILDLEPLIDLTDFNLFIFYLFVITLLSLFMDSFLRKYFIGFSIIDTSSYSYVFVYIINIVGYLLLIFFVFFLHIMSPMDFYKMGDFFLFFTHIKLFFCLFIILAPIFLIYVINFIFLKYNNIRLYTIIVILFLIIIVLLLLFIYHYTFTSLVGNSQFEVNSFFLLVNDSNTYYSPSLSDEWFTSNKLGFIINFQGLQVLIFNLIVIVVLFLYVITIMSTIVLGISGGISSAIRDAFKVNKIILSTVLNIIYIMSLFVFLSFCGSVFLGFIY